MILDKATTRIKITRPPKVVHRRPHRPRPTTSAPSTLPARSSPRPFSKITYDDYEDYYVEPVDVPLSGKVSDISHNTNTYLFSIQ